MIEKLPEDSKMKSEDEIKHKALIDNTAQGIFNNLKDIENKREIYERHWIWELMQNALDAAQQDRKAEVQIIKNDKQITFKHNGRPFKPEEVAHLIYHGSTKTNRELDIGRFGTGFITTHLLSRKVKVNGVREDNKKFEFELNREGNSSEEIITSMETTWEQYKSSFSEIIDTPNHTAEYAYPLNKISSKTVDAGIKDLIEIAPYILAFNDKLGAINIIYPTYNLKFELNSEDNETTYIHKVVKEEENGLLKTLHELWIIKDDDVEIAIKGKNQGSKICIESLHGIPKIFLAFPLFGTQDLSFPAVINSRKFVPTEKRDGIFLGRENTEDIKRNKALLDKARELFFKLISSSDSNKWENIHTLLSLNSPPKKDWLDQDWYNVLLKKSVGDIFNLNVLKTESGSFICPKDGLIPIVDSLEEEKVERLWNLCSQFLNYKDKIPAKKLAFKWAGLFYTWKNLGLDLTKREITVEKIVGDIEISKTLQDFKFKLDNNKDELEILNDIYKLLIDSKKQYLFDNKNILLNQSGTFGKKPLLFTDVDIDDALKDISEKLGENIRNKLLHSKISDNVKKLLSSKKQEEVLNQVVTTIKKPNPVDNLYLQANIDLFSWLLDYNKLEHFEGYPVLSSKEKTISILGKANKEKLLAPKNVWNVTARNYDNLFPQDLIISSLYYEKISHKEKWDKLENEGLILINPLYKEKEKLSREDLEFLLAEGKLEEEKEHELSDDIEVSKIAFLDTKDKGIIDTIRNSKDKARKFLAFLFVSIIEEDIGWNRILEVECGCGATHKIYPAFWIARLKIRQWVPLRKDKSVIASAQNLALLLEGDTKLLHDCNEDKPSRLLSRLNISIGELMMRVAAKDEKTKLELDKAMGSLFGTFTDNPSQLSKIAQLAKSEPELFIKEMEKRLKIREQIRRNQFVGSLVEDLLKNMLEKEGFKVKRTGVGSDFIIEYDFVENNEEMIFEVIKENRISFYIELKATSQDFAKMTLPQATEARDKSDKYALCVVKLNGLELNEETIKNTVKFVIDIGHRIQDKVSEAENLKNEQEKITVEGDIEIEVNEGPIRFKINRSIWEEGKTFEQFYLFLREQ